MENINQDEEKQKSTRQLLIEEIDVFCAKYGMKPQTLTRAAINNSRTYDGLVSGGGLNIDTMDELRLYMEKVRREKTETKG